MGRFLRRALIALVGLLALLVAGRALLALSGPGLSAWHTEVPPEPTEAALDRMDWAGWLAAEERAFAFVARDITPRLRPAEQVPVNRFWPGSPMHPARFATDWNRSFVLEPAGAPRGVAVMVHGLTDAPYSVRHLALDWQAAGFLVIAPRMPGHGTAPAGLAAADHETWQAALRLAVREARRRVPAPLPLHLVGYSNGGALVLLHAARAAAEPRLHRAERVVLVSPMIGVTGFARFAGLAGLPALLPAFDAAAWLGIEPEYNPFKFNSFPVNAARQSHRVTVALEDALRRAPSAALPPVLSFQSLADATVSTPAVARLHARLPGSELVLFDVNRTPLVAPLLTGLATEGPEALLPPAPRTFGVRLVTNGEGGVVERRAPAGATGWTERPLGLAWPEGIFSLSHVALPFPPDDPLYGFAPAAGEGFGIRLGALAPRGERGVLAVDTGGLMRLGANPFHPHLRAVIREAIGAP